MEEDKANTTIVKPHDQFSSFNTLSDLPPMAIPSSPGWSPASINSAKATHKLLLITFNSPSKFFSLLSLHCGSLRVSTASSNPAGSPILEDPSIKPIVLPEPDPKIQDFQELDSEGLNGLLCALFEHPQTEELAYNYYGKAKGKPDFRPEKSTLKHLSRYLGRTKNWDSILSMSEDLIRFQVLPDSLTCCRLVSKCIRFRKFRLVSRLLEVFKNDQEIAVAAFESAMKGYNKLHMYSSTISAYGLLKSAGVGLDPGCYCWAMEAYMKTGDSERVLALFKDLETGSVIDESTPFLGQIYRILCESLGKSGRAFEALEYFRDMTGKGIAPHHKIYSSLICSFARIREVKGAEELFCEAESMKMLRDPAVFLKLVLMYVEEGVVEKTVEMVSAMKRVKIRVSDCIFCAVVNGFSKKRGLRAAAKVYDDLVLQGCEPGQVTYASIICVYYRLGLYLQAEKVFSEMENKGFDKCVVAYSNMIAMYGKAGKPSEAMRLVAKMKERGCEPNVWIYNTLLDMHAKLSNMRQVEKTWKEMKRRKILPDRISYTTVITAYSKAKDFEACMKYYEEFRFNGGVIDRALAGIMVSIFSKMSRIDKLVMLLQDMKTEGTRLDGRLYRSALNSLRDAGLQVQAKWLQQSFGMT